MSFKNCAYVLLFVFIFFLASQAIFSYEIFIYRPYLKNKLAVEKNKFSLHGEFFAQLQFPSNFPSYNDQSGAEDRWNYGFQNLVFLSNKVSFLAQLVTHDDGHQRTKFDWHFSLKYSLFENFLLIIGHDSNHDSDYQSFLYGKAYFLNRNYLGCGLPFKVGDLYVEPFTRFFHHSNQRGHLDLSGNKLRQEYGLRIGYWSPEGLSLSFQILSQTEKSFSLGQAFLADLIIRIKLTEWLELSLGAGIWGDIQASRLGNKQKFHKLIWGIAIPF